MRPLPGSGAWPLPRARCRAICACGSCSLLPGMAASPSFRRRLSAASIPRLFRRSGAVDSYALIQRHHDPRLRDSAAPSDPTEAALVEMCERVRCEALGARRFPGVATNLVARHRDRMRKADLLNAHLASLIPLAEGLRMVLRDSLLDFADPSIATAGFWMWDRWLRARFADRFMALRAAIDDQRAYAVHSRGLIRGCPRGGQRNASTPPEAERRPGRRGRERGRAAKRGRDRRYFRARR